MISCGGGFHGDPGACCALSPAAPQPVPRSQANTRRGDARHDASVGNHPGCNGRRTVNQGQSANIRGRTLGSIKSSQARSVEDAKVEEGGRARFSARIGVPVPTTRPPNLMKGDGASRGLDRTSMRALRRVRYVSPLPPAPPQADMGHRGVSSSTVRFGTGNNEGLESPRDQYLYGRPRGVPPACDMIVFASGETDSSATVPGKG